MIINLDAIKTSDIARILLEKDLKYLISKFEVE
jgi:hypothetical protein